MTIHICRGLSSLSSSLSPATGLYFLSIFMHHVLGYSIKANVNFDITSSSFKKASYNQNIPFTYPASITSSGNTVTIPSIVYSVTNQDINRILALKSATNPTYNSGLFRILSVDTGSNKVTIDYQSSDLPISDNDLIWTIYSSEHEITSSWVTSSNGSTGYASSYNSNCSRIMLEKENYLFARLCLEDSSMVQTNIPAGCSISIGASSRNDIPEFNKDFGVLNGPLYFDTTSSLYRGTSIGFNTRMNSSAWPSGKFTFTAIGNDINGTTLAIARNEDFITGGNALLCFGYPEEYNNEILQTKDIISNIFVIGGTNQTQEITIRSGFHNDNHLQGLAWNDLNTLSSCILSQLADIRNLTPNFRTLTTANVCPIINKTEVSNIELIVGTLKSNLSTAASPIFNFTPKRLGNLPFVKIGRTNYATWSLTPDKLMYHLSGGIYLQWSGPSLSTNLTGSQNVYLLPSYSNDIQVLQLEPAMYDPVEEVINEELEINKDIDANRYKKTYSYYRQQNIDMELIKIRK